MRKLTLLAVSLALGCGGMEEVEGGFGEDAGASSWDPTATPTPTAGTPTPTPVPPGYPDPTATPTPTPRQHPVAPELPTPPIHPTSPDPDPVPDPDPDPGPDPAPPSDPCAPYEDALLSCAEAYSCTLGGSLDLFCASFFCSYEWTDLEMCRVVCASWQEAGGEEAGLDCTALLDGQGG